jgi:hypothetical protein
LSRDATAAAAAGDPSVETIGGVGRLGSSGSGGQTCCQGCPALNNRVMYRTGPGGNAHKKGKKKLQRSSDRRLRSRRERSLGGAATTTTAALSRRFMQRLRRTDLLPGLSGAQQPRHVPHRTGRERAQEAKLRSTTSKPTRAIPWRCRHHHHRRSEPPLQIRRPPAGSCPGGGVCNGSGGQTCCQGCPALNNRVM